MAKYNSLSEKIAAEGKERRKKKEMIGFKLL